MTGPLLITSDAALAADVQRLAAAAGVTLDHLSVLDPAARRWRAATLVLLGADQATAAAAAAPPRRDGLHIVGLGPAPDSTFRAAVDLGAASVAELPVAESWLVELLADVGEGASRRAVVIGVVGGSGGVGASVLAAGLAVSAGASGPALLVDLDPLGPGLVRLLGLEDAEGVGWRDLAGTRGRLAAQALASAVPATGTGAGSAVGVLGWPDGGLEAPEPTVVREVLAAARRGHDWVVVDLARHGGDDVAEAVGSCDLVALLAQPEVAALAAAVRVVERLGLDSAPTGAVVRTARGGIPGADVARALGLPLLSELRRDRRLDERLRIGLGPLGGRRCPVASAARAVLAVAGGSR